MTRQHHGVLSLLILLTAIIIGINGIARVSLITAVIYVVFSIIGFTIVIYSFCSKCPCRLNSCGHVFPGKITKMLPKRDESAYRIADYLGALVPLVFILLFPQLWLTNNLLLLVAFWLLVLFALTEIYFKVCKGCSNCYCPMTQKDKSVRPEAKVIKE